MDIINDRRALHAIPELELTLPKTAAYLKNTLAPLKCALTFPMGDAICAFFDFGKEEAIAFRADMDALPIPEETGLPFASTHPGRMHACGHDGHMATLLELARRLDQKETLPHNVLLIFQPGEESPGGAKPLCETGILEKYHVKAIFGLHLWPGLEKGVMHTRAGGLMSRGSELNVDVYGKSSHIGNAAAGIDATAAAVEFYRQMRAAEAELPDDIFRLLNFGKFESGTVRNAISAHAHMEGSLRAFDDETFNHLRERLFEIKADVEGKFGCKIGIWMSEGYPAVINTPEMVAQVQKIAPVKLLDKPSMTSEDFAEYQLRVPGVFFFLGTGDTAALHATTFNFDEEILLKGADFFEKLAENFQ